MQRGRPAGRPQARPDGSTGSAVRAALAAARPAAPRAAEEPWEAPVPFGATDLPAFPVDVLPRWQREWVAAEAEATQTPPDLAAYVALGALATAVHGKDEVQAAHDHHETLNLYLEVVLGPGNRKSAVYRDGMTPIEAHERAEVDRMAPAIAEADARRRIAEQALAAAEARAAKAQAGEREALEEEATRLARDLAAMPRPVAPRYLVGDATPEALASLLYDQGGRLALASAEGGVLDSPGRYAKDGRSNLDVYLQAHCGDTLRIDRRGRAEFVERPTLTIVLAVQPGVLREAMARPEFRDRGFVGRFLYAIPTSLLGHRKADPEPMPPEVRAAYRAAVTALLRMPPGADAGRSAPHILRFDPEARRAMQDFVAWLEPQLAEGGELGAMADWAGKLVGAVARIAALFHLGDRAMEPQPWAAPITADVARRAIRLGREYLIPHARAAYAEMGADPALTAAQHVLAWIEQGKVTAFTKREAFNALRGRFQRAGDVDEPLRALEERGYIRPAPPPDRPGPGRKPSPGYTVNPAVHARSAATAAAPAHTAAAPQDTAADAPTLPAAGWGGV